MNPSASSNNILNMNLSGSFHVEQDDGTDDENILVASSSSHGHTRNDRLDNIRGNSRPTVPSTSTGRIGVAAIPNTRFNNQNKRRNNDPIT